MVDLDLFYDMVKFGHFGCCMGKKDKTVDLCEAIVAYGIQVDICNHLNELL